MELLSMSSSSANFLVLIVCFLAGILLRLSKRLPQETPVVLNGFVFYISLPAVILLQFHDISFSQEAFLPVCSAWLLFGGSVVLFGCMGRWLKIENKTLGALILTAGMGNTSFVGYPLLEALYGSHAIKTGILVDQLGSFPILSSLGIVVASYYSARNVSATKIVRRIFAFPPIYALLLALVLRPFSYPLIWTEFLQRLGSTLTPLALVSVGYQVRLNWKLIHRNSKFLSAGLAYKLVLGPLLISLFYYAVLRVQGEPIQISIVEGAMAPMITAAIIAAEYELNSELATLMVGIGIPISFVTVPLWARWLGAYL
jgi:predicted permease